MNSIFTISPYRYNAGWVFDDPERGLIKEALVAGIPEIIEQVVSGNSFTLHFSDSPFPSAQFYMEKAETDMGGTWYNSPYGKGWLCPALFKYFPSAPEKIYLEVKEI